MYGLQYSVQRNHIGKKPETMPVSTFDRRYILDLFNLNYTKIILRYYVSLR